MRKKKKNYKFGDRILYKGRSGTVTYAEVDASKTIIRLDYGGLSIIVNRRDLKPHNNTIV